MPRTTPALAAALCALLAAATPAAAQVVGTRASLASILRQGAVTEDFERFAVAPNDAISWAGTALDAATSVPGQGAGMVRAGVRFESAAGNFQVAGAGYYGLPSNTFTAWGDDNFADLVFTQPVEAFGLDLLEYGGYGDAATISVYGAGNTLLHTEALTVSGATPQFFGYQSAGSIERVRIDAASWYWAPLLDNVSFGVRATGSRITSRAALDLLLGAGGAVEDFERFVVPPNDAISWAGTALDAATSVPGQGAGMVRPDIRFESAAGNFQVSSAGYYGMPSNTFTAWGDDNYGGILFSGLVNAVGLDLREYGGYGDAATISVYGDGGALLHQETMALNGAASQFFGYRDARAIRRVRIDAESWYWAPLVDDIAYGAVVPTSPVPEPATLALLGGGLALLGLARRRRRASPRE